MAIARGVHLVIDDPVIGEDIVVVFLTSGQRGRIKNIHEFGCGVDIEYTRQQRGPVSNQYVYRIAWSFAGPIPVTWRTHDPTPRELVPVLPRG